MDRDRLLSLLLERTRDVVILLDSELRVTGWYGASTTALGWTASEALGKNIGSMLAARPEHEGRADELLSALEAPMAEDFLVRGRDGLERVMSFDVVPLEGPPRSYVVIGTDRTERQRIADQLSRARTLEHLPLVAGGVCHDLNNLLAVIGSAIDLAERQVSRQRCPIDALREARSAMERAAELTQQLGNVSRGAPPIRRPTCLAPIIRSTARFSLVGRRTELECRVPDELWPVEADAGQISQVLQNLVTNAAEAMNDEGRVVVEAENASEPPDVPTRFRTGPHVVLRVRDRGAGIPDSHRKRIFEPFFTTKERGTGLGLSTSSAIVRAHDGFMHLETGKGTGTTFEVWLPAGHDKA